MKKAYVDGSVCRGCGCCVRSCPRKALRFGARFAEVREGCTGCGLCARSCPFDAISIKDREDK